MYPRNLAIAVLALATACATGGVSLTNQNIDTAYNAGEFAYAGAGRDLRVDVAGNPFGGDPAAFATNVTDAMQGRHWGQRTNFTTSPGDDARALYRVVFLFNPPISLNAIRLCRDAPSALPTEATDDGTVLYGAFCRGDKKLTSIKGHVSATSGAQDPAFRELVGQVTNGLFPPERDIERDQDRCLPMMNC